MSEVKREVYFQNMRLGYQKRKQRVNEEESEVFEDIYLDIVMWLNS